MVSEPGQVVAEAVAVKVCEQREYFSLREFWIGS
jgi:hypothetical protein